MSTTSRHATLEWLSDRLALTEFLSILSSFGLIYVELDNRKPPRQALAEALARPLGSYARWPRVLGLSVVVLGAFQIFTGALLALYYLPTPISAHESTGVILRDVSFGWLIHQAHYWGSQLLIFVLLVRLARYFAHRIYRAPRELEWMLALALLAVAVVGDASGRLLLWSSDAYWLGVRMVETLGEVPVLGPLAGLLLGGEGTYLSGLTLIRAYGLHVAIVPAAFLVIIYLHFSSVRRLGLNESPGEPKISGTPILRRHLSEIAMVLVVGITILVTLAVLAPQDFPCAADPYATLPAIELPWYLLAPASLFELTRRVIPPAVLAGLLLVFALGLLLVPFLDRGPGSSRWPRWHRWTTAAIAAAWLLLTIHGFSGVR